MSDPDEILNGDPDAVAAIIRATGHVLDADDENAYIVCRLEAPAILARHPELGHDPMALAVLMVKRAADAALLIIPPVNADMPEMVDRSPGSGVS